MSGTRLSVHGVSKLLKRLPLEVFDCGDLTDSAKRDLLKPSNAHEAAYVLSAIAQCLTLRWLRISHYVVTGLTQMHDEDRGEVPARRASVDNKSLPLLRRPGAGRIVEHE